MDPLKQVYLRACVLQFCVSDVGTLSTLITPGSTSSTTEPAAGTSGRCADTECAPPDKPGRVIKTGYIRMYIMSSTELKIFQSLKMFERQSMPGSVNITVLKLDTNYIKVL